MQYGDPLLSQKRYLTSGRLQRAAQTAALPTNSRSRSPGTVAPAKQGSAVENVPSVRYLPGKGPPHQSLIEENIPFISCRHVEAIYSTHFVQAVPASVELPGEKEQPTYIINNVTDVESQNNETLEQARARLFPSTKPNKTGTWLKSGAVGGVLLVIAAVAAAMVILTLQPSSRDY